jgi:hypothetical protein
MTLERFRPWSVLSRFWEDAEKTIPQDVSGSTFASEMRIGTDTVTININVDDAALGEITLYLTAEETGDLPPNATQGRWDLEQTTGGVPTTAVPAQPVSLTTPVTVP